MEEIRMTFGEILYKLRKNRDLKQIDVAKQIGVQKNTISNYENDISKPNYDKLVQLCNLFQVNPNDLMEEDLKFVDKKEIPLDIQQLKDKYDHLTPNNKSIVDYIFGMEEEEVEPIIRYESIVTDDVIYFPLVEQEASAGIGDEAHQYSDEEDMVCFPKNRIPKGATHAIIIDGHSMEPRFFDKQIVFISAGQDCNDGEYGIYQVIQPDKTKVYCKQLQYDEYGRRYLHSVSSQADDPEITEEEGTILNCIGKIIMK